MSNVESGVALFSRLSARPTLANLYPQIFQNNGPLPNEVIEISGDLSCGKTLLLTEIIAHAILPLKHNEHKIGGKNATVILLNTDHHFDLFRLISILKKKMHASELESTKLNEESRQAILKESLERLIILDIFSLEQLYVTFYKLETILNTNFNVSLICIDGISSYYWSNRSFIENLYHIDTFLKKMLEKIHFVTKEYSIVIIYTKPSYFASKSNENQVKKNSQFKISYKINLKKHPNTQNNDTDQYKATIMYCNNEIIQTYTIGNHIVWIDL